MNPVNKLCAVKVTSFAILLTLLAPIQGQAAQACEENLAQNAKFSLFQRVSLWWHSPSTLETKIQDLQRQIEASGIPVWEEAGPDDMISARLVNGENIQAIIIPSGLKKSPALLLERLTALEQKLRQIQELQALGLRLRIDFVTNFQVSFLIQEVQPSQDPLLETLRQSMQQDDVRVHFDSRRFNTPKPDDGVTNGTQIFLNPNNLQWREALEHELEHARNWAQCLRTGDCAKVIRFRSRYGQALPNIPADYPSEFRSDEVEAWGGWKGLSFLAQIDWLRRPRTLVESREGRRIYVIEDLDILVEFVIPPETQDVEQLVRETVARRLRQLEIYHQTYGL